MSILTTDQARQLYDRIADRYDFWLVAYRLARIEKAARIAGQTTGPHCWLNRH